MNEDELLASMRNSSGETLAEVRKRQDDAVAEAFANAEAAGQRQIHTRAMMYPAPSTGQVDGILSAFGVLGDAVSLRLMASSMIRKRNAAQSVGNIVTQVRADGCAHALERLANHADDLGGFSGDEFHRATIVGATHVFGPAQMLTLLSNHISTIGNAAGSRQSLVEEQRAKALASEIAKTILEIEQQESLGANNQPPTIAVDKV